MKVPSVSSNTAQQALMRAWQVQAPEAPPKLNRIPVPAIVKPNQVLIKVKAASVNPIDTRMAKGYGRSILGVWKQFADRSFGARLFPLITGRDCSGIVEEVGNDVKLLRPGDEVGCFFCRRSFHLNN
ncbi:unnamed protein product [Cylicostephanus goldi]|uniref:Alcohol dehydrogenase-like N-terminal domain-containing protein n=1 Tax=Cylicostephanus goldi TaxID=71465 RepID=A0A3P6TD35_CYLGO|nr:unnamed protein product [Cylicostephanus goldi]